MVLKTISGSETERARRRLIEIDEMVRREKEWVDKVE